MSDPVAQDTVADWSAAPEWAICRTTDRGGTWYWNCEPHWDDVGQVYTMGIDIELHVMRDDLTPGPRRIERRPQEQQMPDPHAGLGGRATLATWPP